MKKRWLVTGGAGFIGSHIAAHLRRRGEHVVVLDNFVTGTRDNARFASPNLLIHGDIRNPSTVRRALKKVDFVLHQAALRSVPRSLEDPFSSNDVNVSGTLTLLLEASRAKVKRFVYASSSSAYGDGKIFPQVETQMPMPISPNAVSKLAAEYYCGMFSRTYGLETVSLRYFNVFGPRQDPASKYAAVIPKFILAALKNETIEIHGDGKQSRDFTYIDNVVQANLLAATRNITAPCVFNVAVQETNSVLDIVRILEKQLGRKLKKQFFPRRRGDVRKTYGDISAIRRELGYRPAADFEQGLLKTLEYFRSDK